MHNMVHCGVKKVAETYRMPEPADPSTACVCLTLAAPLLANIPTPTRDPQNQSLASAPTSAITKRGQAHTNICWRLSHIADSVELVRHFKSRHVRCDCGRHTSNVHSVLGVETELFFNLLRQVVQVNPSLRNPCLDNFRGRVSWSDHGSWSSFHRQRATSFTMWFRYSFMIPKFSSYLTPHRRCGSRHPTSVDAFAVSDEFVVVEEFVVPQLCWQCQRLLEN